MESNENIINPFRFYPSNKKTNIMTKYFPLEYDQNTDTWTMEGNGIRLINIPNDIWVVTYLRDYVCSFYINAEAITAPMRIIPIPPTTFSLSSMTTRVRISATSVCASAWAALPVLMSLRPRVTWTRLLSTMPILITGFGATTVS